MRVAITARGPGLDFPIDESYGRAYWIMIIDTESGDIDALDNSEIRNVLQSAGEKVSYWLADLDIDVVVTGKVGPKALRQLQEHKISVYHGATGLVVEALNDWKNGRLELADVARCEGSPFCLVSRNHAASWTEQKVELRLVKSS
ncbi:MAG: dinitrogenase iron-molybdenum cofactor biosynthesis protein [Desulfuromonas sp.]|nr:MAG: dinitrogenase iron-molybdenum cofactor biosynthesis protein [Desulfuromonas sp.]